MDKDKKLRELFENDPLGLLNVTPIQSPARNEEERFIESFEEINEFYREHQREPNSEEGLQEYRLHARLQAIRKDPSKVNLLKNLDVFGLLEERPTEPLTFEQLLESDPLGLLDEDTLGLFDLKNIEPTDKSRAETDFVARRTPCLDFSKYEDKFKRVQLDLKRGKRKLIPFKVSSLREKTYYVHNGVLFFVEQIDITRKEHYKPDGTRVREDGRTRCIFENGTESNMYKRSIEKLLYTNGQVVTENEDDSIDEFNSTFGVVSEEDQEVGYIYIAKSLSQNTEIKTIANLYKIGFSRTPIEERIKNASKEPTYLMADVRIVMAYQCFNLNPQKLEKLLHQFFGRFCLNIDVFDQEGNRHTPREWFIAPLYVIEEAVNLILSEKIMNYRYDGELEEIVERQ